MCISSAWTWNPQVGIISAVKAISKSKIQNRAEDRTIVKGNVSSGINVDA